MSTIQQKNETDQSPLDILNTAMAKDMEATNAIILSYMQSDVPLIPQLATYLIAAGGKRIRPLLTLASASIFNADMSRAHHLAAAVEFIHTATLLHDDVVDGSIERRGKQSANIVFGNESSVLVGDYLFSRAFQMMVNGDSLDILRVLSNAAAVITEGEVFQLSIQNNLETSIEDYLTVIKGKTAALFAAACEVGPILGEQNDDTIKAMRDYGMNLGIAFQIIDDVLDYNAERTKFGKVVGDDFREGKMTAPIILAIKNANDEEKKFWQRTLGDKNQTDEDLETALKYMDKHDTLTQGMDLARSYAGKAISALALLPETPVKKTLIDLVTFTIEREY